MPNSPFPPAQGRSPSAWSRRLPAAVLALVSCTIATYLGLFQLGRVADVWEPFFGNGSRVILTQSAVSHLLPVPDAVLGALVYVAEAVAECVGGRQRWRTWPAAVYVTGVLAAGLALTAVVLVGCQVLWFRAYCTLCLASAACSLVIAALAAPEVRAAWEHRTNALQPAHPGPGAPAVSGQRRRT